MAAKKLISDLVSLMASGKISSEYALPVLKNLSETTDGKISFLPLIQDLKEEKGKEFQELIEHLKKQRRKYALAFHQRRKKGILAEVSVDEQTILGDLPLDAPLYWTTESVIQPALELVLFFNHERFFLKQWEGDDLKITKIVEEKFRSHLHELQEISDPWFRYEPMDLLQEFIHSSEWKIDELSVGIETWLGKKISSWKKEAEELASKLPGSFPRHLPENILLEVLFFRLMEAKEQNLRTKLIDTLCCWHSNQAIPFLMKGLKTMEEGERAALIFHLRLGLSEIHGWDNWVQRFDSLARANRLYYEQLLDLMKKNALELFYCGYLLQEDSNPQIQKKLEELLSKKIPPIEAEDFVERWREYIPGNEQNILLGLEVEQPTIPAAEEKETDIREKLLAVMQETPEIAAEIKEKEIKEPEKIAPVIKPEVEIETRPSFYAEHVHPFLVDNWYLIAGIIFVIFGASLLAYYTWDKHWLVRYTLMPVLLASFTFLLAYIGDWVEKRGSEFASTGAIMRGAAICLLPINFMVVALIAGDAQVTAKTIAVPLMGFIYIVLFYLGLQKWFAAIHPQIAFLGATTVLLLSSQVFLLPIAGVLEKVEPGQFSPIICGGFYLGFFIMTVAFIQFSQKILTAELVREKRIPWFFTAALFATYLQTFAWVHHSIRYWPNAFSYSPLVILTGWLILFLESKSISLSKTDDYQKDASFLGYALVILGVLMGASNPWMRVFTLFLAGTAWLYQGYQLNKELIFWISLTFYALAGASLCFLPGFPESFFPLSAILLALIMESFISTPAFKENQKLKIAARGMQVLLLFNATFIAVFCQWHYKTTPFYTIFPLLLIVFFLLRRALLDKNLTWIHGAMIIMSLSLPYMGFVEMQNPTIIGNNMVFGLALLSFLWIALLEIFKIPLLLKVRSDVLWFYGIFAVTAMFLRTFVEGNLPAQPLFLRSFMDYLGPLFMCCALALAAYFSRSLIPSVMAVLILVVLFPAMKADFQATFSFISWGSGLGSSITALFLTVLCFYVRDWKLLKNLSGGDLYMGKKPFPLRRHDASLFTIPLMFTALFLTIKVDLINFFKNTFTSNLQVKTGIALMVTSIVWTLQTVYHRKREFFAGSVHLGWFWFLIGFTFTYYANSIAPHWSIPFFMTGFVLTLLFFFYRRVLEKKYPWVKALLARPTQVVLQWGTLFVSELSILSLFLFESWQNQSLLIALLIFQLLWHGYRSRSFSYGVHLFFLISTVMLSVAIPGNRPILDILNIRIILYIIITLTFLINTLHLVLEKFPRVYCSCRSILIPNLFLTSLLVFFAGLFALGLSFLPGGLSPFEMGFITLILFLSAKVHASVLFTLLASILLYPFFMFTFINVDTSLAVRAQTLLLPLHLSLYSLILALLTHAGITLKKHFPWLFVAPFKQPFFQGGSASWLFTTALIFASIAPIYHTYNPGLRNLFLHLPSPYISGFTFLLVSSFLEFPNLLWGAGSFFALGNIHLIRVFLGSFLLARGLSHNHLVCLGLGLNLLLLSILRPSLKDKPEFTIILNRVSLFFAAAILILLGMNYFTHPDIQKITGLRFVISGIMSLLTALYFRQVARKPGPGEEVFTKTCQSFYHFGITLFFWCGALLLPIFRNPNTVLIALSFPLFYFFVNAEIGQKVGLPTFKNYHQSASSLAFLLLALYAFRAFFQMMLFPSEPVGLWHYHFNSPFIMVLSILMLRLHGLGGNAWLAFYGGLGLMGGSFFALTSFPGFSPFSNPVPAAWCAIFIAHFWTMASAQHSPISIFVKSMAKLDAELWLSLRTTWGRILLFCSQGVILWGLLNYFPHYFQVAPLLLAAASIFIYHGILRESKFYFQCAILQIVLALHTDFLLKSLLASQYVIWVILFVWALLLSLHPFLTPEKEFRIAEKTTPVFLFFIFLHILFHHPGSYPGLFAALLTFFLLAFTPCRAKAHSNPEDRFYTKILFGLPVWLVYFSQSNLQTKGLSGMLDTWPILCTIASVFIMGSLCHYFQVNYVTYFNEMAAGQYRRFRKAFFWMEFDGLKMQKNALLFTFISSAAYLFLHNTGPYLASEMILFSFIFVGMAIAFYQEGEIKKSKISYYLMMLSLSGLFFLVRKQLLLTNIWHSKFDVWACIFFTFLSTVTKSFVRKKDDDLSRSLVKTICILPAISLFIVYYKNLGIDMALLVIGLNSLIFAFLGKEQKDSPFNAVAILGVSAFILLTFWSKLHIRVVHAYIIPVGIGVLILLQLFGEDLEAETKNNIRLVTILAMLCSTLWYALVDPRYPIIFNLTLIFISLFIMATGALFRISIFIPLGFAGLLADIFSLGYKLLGQMERTTRMSTIGSLLLLLGIALVFGAIYFKTHRENIKAKLVEWHRILEAWE
ncbi:hypothetical protein ACFL35_14620 [Candidatus Riflebacteria bacterium]